MRKPPEREVDHAFRDAPNTRPKKITLDAPYHHAGAGTVDSGQHTPATCRKCRVIADPSHVCSGPRGSLSVYCAAHCPTCVAFRRELRANPAKWIDSAHQAELFGGIRCV